MQLSLSQHISRLLFEHECVIVPDFGAFLTRYHHAEVNPATNMVRPPSRRIYFNPGLKENDGLLAKSLNLSENISYKNALDEIRDAVKQWRDVLRKGDKVRLQGIGKLFIDEKGKLQYLPSLENNYQRSSYGLAIFRTPQVEREIKIRTAIQRSIEKHSPVPVAVKEVKLQEEDKKDKSSRRIPWAAVLGPVIFAGIIGAGYIGIKSEPFQNVSGLNWLEWSRSSVTLDYSGEVISKQQTEDNAVSSLDIKELDSELTEETLESSSVSLQEDEIPVMQLYPYHIVVGSFKDAVNAENYVDELKSKGFDAYTAAGDNRFMRVAVGNLATREQAEKALIEIRRSVNSQAWIYTN